MDDNEDLYGGSGSAAPEGSPEEEAQESPEQESQEDDGGTNTALINSSICPGMKVGDKMELTIEKVLDSGEYEVSYQEPSKDQGESESAPAMSSDSEMAGYMS